jgi:serine/threonine-protein kinase
MSRNPIALLVLGIASLASAGPAWADADLDKLTASAQKVLKTYCQNCHGRQFKAPGLDVLQHKILVSKRAPDPDWIVPGKPEDSYLWSRLGIDKDMPPESVGKDKIPSDAERQIIHDWIAAGAPAFAETEQRSFKTLEDVLEIIKNDLKTTAEEDRKFQKYFTMGQLHNNPNISDAELRLGRAALSKLLNGLSWKRAIVVPEAADKDEIVFTIDLRKFGWDRNGAWDLMVKEYPYALNYGNHEQQEVRELSKEIAKLSGDKLSWLRADWFIANASRPPLYHAILGIPEDVSKLRSLLNVNVESDFRDNQLVRAAFATSLVSKQNRVVDRHWSLYGAYWESYDFKPQSGDNERGNVFKFPLGPKFEGNPFAAQAFEHDGGEIIFNLPNGLQGYMLTDNKGKRINEGPTDVVYDSLNTAGAVSVVNGLSCMACHKDGMRTFTDTMRSGQAAGDDSDKEKKTSFDVRDKVQKLVPRKADMDLLVRRDTDTFLRALEAATAPFLKVDQDKDREMTEFAEPVGTIALLYVKDLGAKEVALDLGLKDASEVPSVVNGNRLLRRAGLGPLGLGGTIKRDIWTRFIADRDPGANPFQVMAEQLEQGEPLETK